MLDIYELNLTVTDIRLDICGSFLRVYVTILTSQNSQNKIFTTLLLCEFYWLTNCSSCILYQHCFFKRVSYTGKFGIVCYI